MANQMPGKAVLITSIAAALVVLVFIATWTFVTHVSVHQNTRNNFLPNQWLARGRNASIYILIEKTDYSYTLNSELACQTLASHAREKQTLIMRSFARLCSSARSNNSFVFKRIDDLVVAALGDRNCFPI